MKTFEYKILPRIAWEDELNELGGQGWDLVTAQLGGKWIFKREINPPPVPGPGNPRAPAYGQER
jgi:hypothetical protein